MSKFFITFRSLHTFLYVTVQDSTQKSHGHDLNVEEILSSINIEMSNKVQIFVSIKNLFWYLIRICNSPKQYKGRELQSFFEHKVLKFNYVSIHLKISTYHFFFCS